MPVVEKVFWHEQSVDSEIVAELNIESVFGIIDLFEKDVIEQTSEQMYEIKGGGYLISDDTKEYKAVYMGRLHGQVWKTLPPHTTFKKENFGGVVLCDPEESFLSWQERKVWITEFLSQLRDRITKAGKKRSEVKVYVKIFDVAAIPELYNMVDGILIYPMNGILYNSKFVLPLGGYLDLSNDDAAESVKQTLQDVAELLSVTQKPEESYDTFVHRLQCHVFNFEIQRALFLSLGGKLDQFEYNGEKVDKEKIFDLAIIRGFKGDASMDDLVDNIQNDIESAIKENETEPILRTMTRLLSISAARVQFGNKIDSANKWLSRDVSLEIRTALQFAEKLATLVGDRRKQKFLERVAIKRLMIEQDKLAIDKKKSGMGDDSKTESEKALGIIGQLQETDAKDFLTGLGASEVKKLVSAVEPSDPGPAPIEDEEGDDQTDE